MKTLIPALLAALLAAAPALAQDQPDNLGISAIYSADVFKDSIAVLGRPKLVADAATTDASKPDSADALSFKPSVDVELATRKKLLDSLLTTTQNTKIQDEIKQTVKSDDLWRQFVGVLNQAGFSSDNIADVTAAYYIIAWQVVNTNTTTTNAKSIHAVRKTVAANMLAGGQVAKLSDAQKQQAASVMAYMATMAADGVNTLTKSGNQAALAILRGQVHDSVMEQGVDLDRVELTDQGFIPR